MSIGILTDSTADLPDELYKKFDIGVIPLTVNFGDDTFIDGVEITSEEFFQKLDQYNEQPTTSMPSVGNFIEKYKELNKKIRQDYLHSFIRKLKRHLKFCKIGC